MKRFLGTLATLLLVSISAFAQSSTPLKGDVNEDGVVDVADIVAIIGIMKANTPQPSDTYYWYVGQTQPTSQTSVTAQDSGTFTNNNWHTINVNNNYSFSNPIYNSESNPISGSSNTNWYVALPADKSYSIYDSDDANDINAGNWTEQPQITVANINYKVYKKVSGSRKFAAYWIH